MRCARLLREKHIPPLSGSLSIGRGRRVFLSFSGTRFSALVSYTTMRFFQLLVFWSACEYFSVLLDFVRCLKWIFEVCLLFSLNCKYIFYCLLKWLGYNKICLDDDCSWWLGETVVKLAFMLWKKKKFLHVKIFLDFHDCGMLEMKLFFSNPSCVLYICIYKETFHALYGSHCDGWLKRRFVWKNKQIAYSRLTPINYKKNVYQVRKAIFRA